MRVRTAKFVRVLTLFGMIALVPLLAACAQSTPVGSGAKVPVPAAEESASTTSSEATLKLLEPTQGAEVSAGTLTVRVETTGLKYTMPSTTNVDGEGHVHFTLDNRPIVMSTEPQAELKDVSSGPHTLKAELVQNDTKPFDPPIEEVIDFTAK